VVQLRCEDTVESTNAPREPNGNEAGQHACVLDCWRPPTHLARVTGLGTLANICACGIEHSVGELKLKVARSGTHSTGEAAITGPSVMGEPRGAIRSLEEVVGQNTRD